MVRKVRLEPFLSDPSWYKDAIIYQVHVKSYFDSNNDGVGDFAGLVEKLDYIESLGVNAIWLLPFYPSPMRDDGYDIAQYRGIYPAYGTMADARRFIREAHKRGIRVITELVINHTSDQHPWFQRARRAKKNSRARNFYVWSDTNKKYEGTRIIFSDTETSNWTWDPVAGQYFWHRFYANQPDLNFDNPEVLREVLNVMRFWFDLGVDGLRLDAIPYLVEREGTSNENLPETHEVLRKIRAELNANYPDRMLLAEANLWPEDIRQYFGNGDECHMAFHFPLMPRMYMAIAQEDRFPIVDILRQMPDIPANCQWAVFLRNHDELTLEMVTDHERDYLWNHYATDKRARLNLGIRRRLAPLVERDRRRIELLNSLLLSMPGTPTLYYGDELGMGDNIFLGDRHGVRTPMQWSSDRNGGFSRADPASLILPPIMDPLYGYQAINVEAQSRDPHSLLNWTRRMLAVRRQQKAFGRGDLKLLAPSNRRILAYLREYVNSEGVREIVLCVANMSRTAQAAELDLSAFAGRVPVEMIGGTLFPVISRLNYLLTLQPYGFYWFFLAEEARLPSWHQVPLDTTPEMTTLIIKNDLADLSYEPSHSALEQDLLPAYFAAHEWLGADGTGNKPVKMEQVVPFSGATTMGAFVIADANDEAHQRKLFLPLAFIIHHEAGSLAQHHTLARVRQKRTVGILTHALTQPDIGRAILLALVESRQIPLSQGRIEFNPDEALFSLDKPLNEVNVLTLDDESFAVVVDFAVVLTPVQRLVNGAYAPVALSRYLLGRGFKQVLPVLGEVIYVDAKENRRTLLFAQAHVGNQGDAWRWMQAIFERILRETSELPAVDNQFSPALTEVHQFAKMLAVRLAELHNMLASAALGSGFEALTIQTAHRDDWVKSMGDLFDVTLHAAIAQRASIGSDLVDWLANESVFIKQWLQNVATLAVGTPAIRGFGDMHLRNILVVKGDAFFANIQQGRADPGKQSSVNYSPFQDLADVIGCIDDLAEIAVRRVSVTDVAASPTQSRLTAKNLARLIKRTFLEIYSKQQNMFALSSKDLEPLLGLAKFENRLRGACAARRDPLLMSVQLAAVKNIVLRFHRDE